MGLIQPSLVTSIAQDYRNEQDGEPEANDYFKIKTIVSSEEHHIYLSDYVHFETSVYTDLIHFLKNAPANDVVKIHLANFGGSVHAGLQLAHAIKECQALTIVDVSAPCYSMGAILALCGRCVVTRPTSYLMFHNYSGGESGKGAELKTSIGEFSKHFEKILRYFCTPFLTEKEVKSLLKDEDVYVHFDNQEFIKRLKRHFKGVEFNVS